MSDASVVSPWERALMAAEKVKERLRRATQALDKAGVSYAVAGGNAVAEWVARVDEGAVRNTRDVDILIRRGDFTSARAALEALGFVYYHLIDVDVDLFIDGPSGRPSEGIHLLYAGEKIKPEYELPAPSLEESERGMDFQVTLLTALVRMKLNSWRDKDRMHLRDMIDVGLIDQQWPGRFPSNLGQRLQSLLDHPEG